MRTATRTTRSATTPTDPPTQDVQRHCMHERHEMSRNIHLHFIKLASRLRDFHPPGLRLRVPLQHPPHHLRRRSLRHRHRHRTHHGHRQRQRKRNPETRQRHAVAPHHLLLRLEVQTRLLKVRIEELPRKRVRRHRRRERARGERARHRHQRQAQPEGHGQTGEPREGLRSRRRDAYGPEAQAIGAFQLGYASRAQGYER
mmetsp:Transcript_5260/g.23301  ORF Transcript_5260/g.23301 Transcript_5260/m.23301 type:complete len:200 (+) Transcript_5260:828-1427(+)